MNTTIQRVAPALLMMLIGYSIPSCARPMRTADDTRQTNDLADDVDLERAYLPLNLIEPLVSQPAPSDLPDSLSERATKRVAKAQGLAEKERFTEAAIELERALRYDPHHPDIYRALAMLHLRADNVERAADHAARAIRGRADMAGAHYVAGRCAEHRGDRKAAMTAYRTALLCGDQPPNGELIAICSYRLAEVLAAEGYLEASLEQYDVVSSALSLNSTPIDPELRALVHNNYGLIHDARSRVFEKLGRFADAAAALRTVIEGGVSNIARSVRHTRLLLRAGQAGEALSAAKRIATDDESVIDLIVECYRALGKPEQAVSELRSRIAKHPDSSRYITKLAGVLVDLNRPNDALDLLRDHTARNSGDLVVWERLVDALLTTGRWNEALMACAGVIRQQAVPDNDCEERITGLASDDAASTELARKNPSSVDDAVVAYLYGKVAIAAERGDAGQAHLENSHQRDPKFVPTRIELARIYLKQYRYDDAIRVAKRTDDATPEDVHLEILLGMALEHLERLEDAEQHLRAATQLGRENVEAMFRLAEVYRRQGKRNSAQQQLHVLLDTTPGHEAARELLALMYMSERKTDAALEQITELKRQTTSPTTIARCDALLDQELRSDPAARRKHMLDAMEQSEEDASTWIAVAQTYGPFEVNAARQAYFNASQLEPQNDEATLGLIDTDRRLLAFEQAADHFRELLRRRPNRHRWRLSLIKLLATGHDFEAALAMARSSVEREDLDPVWRGEYRAELLRTLRWANRSDELLTVLKHWADDDPDDTALAQQLAREYIAQDKADKAVPIRRKLLDADPNGWSALGGMLSALTESGRADRATQLVLDRLDNDPEHDNGTWMLAALLADSDRWEEAIELARNRLLHTSQRETFQDFIIEQLQAMERHEEAVSYVESLVEEATALMQSMRGGRQRANNRLDDPSQLARRPNDPFTLQKLHERLTVLRLRLAFAQVGAKDYLDAEDELSDWIEDARDPGMKVRFLRILAMCQREQGNETRAIQTMERALELQSEDVLLNNDVAYSWIDQGIRLDEAEPMIRFALGSRPRQGAYLDTYGWLLYKKGDFAGAKQWLSRGLHARGDEDPVVSDHLGDACWRLGEKTEAIKYWKSAVKIIGDRNAEDLGSDDERRVHEMAPKKVKAAEGGESPEVSPLAKPSEPDNQNRNRKGGRG